MKIKLANENPFAQEYVELRKACGLSKKSLAAANIALPKSLFSITIRHGAMLIGMGRVVGDLTCHVQIVDIAVHPEYQKQGFSKLIMDKIMNFLKKECSPCCFVNLFADVDFLYHKYGFTCPKTTKGMYLDWSKVLRTDAR